MSIPSAAAPAPTSLYLWSRRALAALFVCVVGLAGAADKPVAELSDADKACLGCHGAEGLKKELASGESLALHVDPTAFARSVHRPIGCTACHTQIKLPEHPGNARTISSARQYTLEQTQSCRACHDRVFAAWEKSLHAKRVSEGNPAAPTCGTCHSPHAVLPPSIQEETYSICLTCHAGVPDIHRKWLPNAALHLSIVACSACHAPAAIRKIDLRLFDDASDKRVVDENGTLQFEKRARAADADGNGLAPLELRALLGDLRHDIPSAMFIGRLEVRNGIDSHELPAKANASQNCARCHSDAAAPFQSVTVSAIGPDLRVVRYDAHSDVLTSGLTVDVLRGFYAIGGTHIEIFDVLLALAVLAGISIPVLHIGMRRWVRDRAKRTGETK